jgi:hypothetical protein
MQRSRLRALGEVGVGGSERREGRGSRTELVRRSHRDDVGRQALLDLVEHAFRVGTHAIDLVHEQQRRHLQPLQRAHQDPRLRLHSFDRRQHEHAAVEHAQHPLHLGDEVRVAGRVDQVHRHVVDRERNDGRLDRDAALLLERERVGARRSLVDAADLVDHACRVQQAFGESCLTGVYMRQDPQIQRLAKHSSIPPSRSLRPLRWQ